MISLGIFGIDAVVFAIVALLTGAGLVWLAMWLAGLISPRSFNPQKGEAYECGIPTRGESMMVAGTIVHRMVPVFRRLYDQLAEPKYVIACGSCAISGGPFRKSYHVAKGIEDIVPVDVFCPGCPPRPEAMIYSIMQLSRKIKVERFFGGKNRQESQKEFLAAHPIEDVAAANID